MPVAHEVTAAMIRTSWKPDLFRSPVCLIPRRGEGNGLLLSRTLWAGIESVQDGSPLNAGRLFLRLLWSSIK